jgi:tripartite-type tricarboxylate transporter receptor subunit TctC
MPDTDRSAAPGGRVADRARRQWRAALTTVAPHTYTPGSRGPGLRLPHLVRHLAPWATPALRVEELNDGFGVALGAAELRSWLGQHGAEPMQMTPREFADFVIRERDRADAIAHAAGIAPTR